MSLDPDSLPELTTPERQLWAAVLLRAVKDLAGVNIYLPGGVLRSLASCRAKAWFESTDYGPGSFVWIATALGLDADAIRCQALKVPSGAIAAKIKAADGRGARSRNELPVFDTP